MLKPFKNIFGMISLLMLLTSCSAIPLNNSTKQVFTAIDQVNLNQQMFQNVHYGYHFPLPENSSFDSDQCLDNNDSNCATISVRNGSSVFFNVEVVEDLNNLNESQMKKAKEFHDFISGDPRAVALKLWDLNNLETNGQKYYSANVPNKEIGKFSRGTFGGETAYLFTLNGSFTELPTDVSSDYSQNGSIIEKPSQIIVLQHNRYLFIIRYWLNDELAQEVASNFSFY
jgi:hypothetical protein